MPWNPTLPAIDGRWRAFLIVVAIAGVALGEDAA